MKRARLIKTGDEAGPTEARAIVVDRILAEIRQLYFERARVLRTGDQAAYLAVDHKIASLKDDLSKL